MRAAALLPVAAAAAPICAYAVLRVGRHRVWLDGTVLCRQRAFTVKRLDLTHCLVEPGYVASGTRLSTIRAAEPITGRRMTIPLLTAGGRPLPGEQLKSVHDAVMAGQRFRRGKHADRAETVSRLLIQMLD